MKNNTQITIKYTVYQFMNLMNCIFFYKDEKKENTSHLIKEINSHGEYFENGNDSYILITFSPQSLAYLNNLLLRSYKFSSIEMAENFLEIFLKKHKNNKKQKTHKR